MRLLQSISDLPTNLKRLDLSCLRHLISGGESNLVETIVALSRGLQMYNLEGDVVKPGFGMTETCAGSIYAKDYPSYDIIKGNSLNSLGKPVPGMQMRIMRASGESAALGETGDLQVRGKPVLMEYFNNHQATRASSTDDGWFITGDRAYLNADGSLNIVVQEKESINLNGVEYFPNEIKTAVENANRAGFTSSYTVVFPHQPSDSAIDELCVVYHPKFELTDIAERVKTANKIILVVGNITTSRPRHIIPLPKHFLQKFALGKFLRAKIRASFEKGEFEQYEDSKNAAIKEFKAAQRLNPTTSKENLVLTASRDIVDAPEEDLGVNNSIFDFGVTSTDLSLLEQRIERDLEISSPFPIGILLSTSTVRGIAGHLDELDKGFKNVYEPVIPLASAPGSSKAPL